MHRITKIATFALAATSVAVAIPSTAMAAANPVEGYTRTDTGWTAYTFQRHDVNGGTITFKPNNLSSGGVCIRLKSVRTGAIFSDTICWTDHSTRTLATGVLAGTVFTIQARKQASGTDTFWSGTMNY
ncbi:hypothetical protein Q0Z83_044430 [Actinoplanes sichuanensis]|uniref:Uncharacterized protein n=1 Tax=Actinoplanes sichuanensis TaxID=512349 RepID=A0ABW4AMQ5_9ACTN|nr:hypothetical protein [Actinoplanes sichuanensis]BEL06252.1 hypothetical protein Q0Z83_044430 [Actinoplanes sichuanensis]